METEGEEAVGGDEGEGVEGASVGFGSFKEDLNRGTL